MRKNSLFIYLFFLPVLMFSQVGIGTMYPNSSSILELNSSSKGLLIPRLLSDERDSIKTPATGLMIYNISIGCLQVNDGTPFLPDWNCLSGKTSVIFNLECLNARNIGVLINGSLANGVSTRIPYTGGNGGTYANQLVTSSGVTGLVANLSSGKLVNGDDSVTYTITGTPSSSGIANFTITLAGQSCTFSRSVSSAAISSISCNSSVNYGTLTGGSSAVGVYSRIPYSGGNGGSHSGQVVNSTGVLGLTATLTSGNFVNGADSLQYTITGVPSSSGTATFQISIGGKSCLLNRTVLPSQSEQLISSNESRVINSAEHALMRGSDGNLYSWGGNTYGQLGLGNVTTYSKNPRLVTANLTGKSFIQATSGHWGSSAALTNTGEVYYAGNATKGGNGNNVFTRALLGGGTSIKALVMATSEGGSIVVGNNNNLYGIGYFGNSGTPDGIVRQINMPTGVTSSNIKFVTGSHHWNIISTSTNIYCIGDGSFGNNGNYNTYSAYTASTFSDIQSLRVAKELLVVKDNNVYKYSKNKNSGMTTINTSPIGQSIKSFHAFGNMVVFETSSKFSFYNVDLNSWNHINFPSGKLLEWYAPEKILSTVILCKFKDNITGSISYMGISNTSQSTSTISNSGAFSFVDAGLVLSNIPSGVSF